MTNSDSLDKGLESLPLVGVIFRRNYGYFRNHTALTNLIHFSFGLGLGVLLYDAASLWGLTLLALGLLGHVYAFLKSN